MCLMNEHAVNFVNPNMAIRLISWVANVVNISAKHIVHIIVLIVNLIEI